MNCPGVADNGDVQQRYRLLGATSEIDFGDIFALRLQLAHSEGGSHVAAHSFDGGLRFSELATGEGRAGGAGSVTVHSSQGPWRVWPMDVLCSRVLPIHTSLASVRSKSADVFPELNARRHGRSSIIVCCRVMTAPSWS
ncbi:MAG: hypothetical protein R3C68_11640 [Myxococcota bacterium]